MKKAISVFVLCALLLSLAGCMHKADPEGGAVQAMADITENPTDPAAEILREVLENKRTIITTDAQTVYLKDYPIHETLKADPSEYTFVDFDGDGCSEVVVNVSSQIGYYLVLHVYEQNVYGYLFGIRSLLGLKTDGSFVGSGGAGTHYYLRMTFEGDQCAVHTEAVHDITGGVYEIDGVAVSPEEAQSFADKRELLQDVQWQTLKSASASES